MTEVRDAMFRELNDDANRRADEHLTRHIQGDATMTFDFNPGELEPRVVLPSSWVNNRGAVREIDLPFVDDEGNRLMVTVHGAVDRGRMIIIATEILNRLGVRG